MEYIELLKELKKYYSNTLIVQYHGLPKAKATIELLTELIYQNAILLQIRDAFDWKNAIGKQLDIIGQWVGVSRVYNNNPLVGNKLSYPQYSRIEADNYDAEQGGYSTYATYKNYDVTIVDAYIIAGETEFSSTWLSATDGGTPLTPVEGNLYLIKTDGVYYNNYYGWNGSEYVYGMFPGGMLTYAEMPGIDNELLDNEYKTVIGLKIIYNNIQNTASEIDNAIWEYFGGKTYYSSEDIATDVILYEDAELTKEFGKVSASSANSITVVDNENNILYTGYYGNKQEDDIYINKLGQVYTTWDTANLELTYHYPSDTYSKIMQICYDKGVLPAPTGTKIQFGGY